MTQRASFRDWVSVVGAALGSFMAVIDIQITNASLREIQGSLAATLDEGSWISTGYLIAEIVVIPLTAWFASVFSLRLYLAVSGALFVVFSVLCGLSSSLPEMILFRVGQGFTGGCLIPASFTIAVSRLPAHQRPIGIVVSGVAVSLAPAIGPTVGGWLTDEFSWRYIFYLNILPGFGLVAMILYGLPKERMQLGRLLTGDWAGIAAMAVGLGTLEVVLEEGQRKDWFGSPLITDCAIVSAIALVAMVVIELTRREPFINLRLLRHRSFACICLCSLVSGLGMYSLPYILPVYLAQVQGYHARQIGVLMVWQGIPQVMIFPVMAALMRRIELRLLIVFGFAVFATSAFMNAYLSHDSAGDQVKTALIGRALGIPFVALPLSALIPFSLDPTELPDASALYNTMRNLGGSFGIALLSTFSIMREHFHFSVIAERMSANSTLLQERVAALAHRFAEAGAGPAAEQQALATLAQMVRREAYVMAYSDCFFILGLALIGSIAMVPLLARPRRPSAGAAH